MCLFLEMLCSGGLNNSDFDSFFAFVTHFQFAMWSELIKFLFDA